MERHGIGIIDWPPYSLDLNPIGHVWKALKQKLCELLPDTDTLMDNIIDIEELKRRLQVAWGAID